MHDNYLSEKNKIHLRIFYVILWLKGISNEETKKFGIYINVTLGIDCGKDYDHRRINEARSKRRGEAR